MKKYSIGYTAGVFDMFHIGHLIFLERCKKQCDYLIVGICDDDYVRNEKHKEPIITENDRAKIVQALKCVDETVIVNTQITKDKLLAFQKLKFNVLFSGDDWKGTKRYKKTEEDFAKIGNIAIEYLPYTSRISSTEIRKKILQVESGNYQK